MKWWQTQEFIGNARGSMDAAAHALEDLFASKVAFVHAVRQLQRWGYRLVDCQVHTPHLDRFGRYDCTARHGQGAGEKAHQIR